MYSDEIDIDRALVAGLIAKQFPQWADLRITKVRYAGTDNAMYRLGDDMVVRLPRVPFAVEHVEKEQQWLPRLAPLLPVAIPVPLGKGVPGKGFPYPWSVYRWLDGNNAVDEPVVELCDAAAQLGRFVAALQRCDATGGPPSFRGGPIGIKDHDVRIAIRDLGADGMVDADLATAAWETALTAPAWDGAPVWVHADIHPANLLVRRGRLAAVIDFGGLGVGDPACDMLPAWTLLTAQTREPFRAEAKVDDATWVRGRGWGLYFGIGAVHAHRVTNPVLAAIGQHAVAEVIADYQRTAFPVRQPGGLARR
jgi:aminoglycoside phosphotransferase (APT) family kinase protein